MKAENDNPYIDSAVKKNSELQYETSNLGLSSKNHDNCFLKQIYTISMYYFINVMTDLMLFALGYEALDEHALFCA